uniref:B box-type domain-containing protein n=1 Tax=Naja naja TaxID=35670 RepID=A0A8C6XWZ1_NAJNA
MASRRFPVPEDWANWSCTPTRTHTPMRRRRPPLPRLRDPRRRKRTEGTPGNRPQELTMRAWLDCVAGWLATSPFPGLGSRRRCSCYCWTEKGLDGCCPDREGTAMAENAFAEPEAPAFQEMCDEFQFLLCDRCHAEVSNPKLLPCLHNLCSQCREENKPIGLCIICGTPFSQSAKIPENQDNTFFANLHFKFNLYQKVTRNQHLVCDNCEIKAEFWCSTCEEFLCLACFRSHQRYLKKENHEARSLKDLRVESYKEFFSTIRRNNTMFCSKMGHSTQMISLYCRQCNQSMCTICALLDSEHMGQHCDISSEIQSRQEELQNTSMELKEKQDTYNKSYSSHEERMRKIEQSRNETRELIQQQIEKMIQILREKGEGYLAEVEAHHDQQVQDVKKNLQEIEGVFQRITSSQRLVEKMHLYASGQEVLEIQPFLATVHNGAETEAATYSRENQSEKLPRNQEQPSNFARKSDKRQRSLS